MKDDEMFCDVCYSFEHVKRYKIRHRATLKDTYEIIDLCDKCAPLMWGLELHEES